MVIWILGQVVFEQVIAFFILPKFEQVLRQQQKVLSLWVVLKPRFTYKGLFMNIGVIMHKASNEIGLLNFLFGGYAKKELADPNDN